MQRPFEGNYWVSLIVAVTSLVPFIIISTAAILYEKQVMQAIGASRTGLSIITATSEAAYAFGALLGGDIAQRFPQRVAFLASEGLFVVGGVVAATAGSEITYGAGMVLLGFATGILLVVALPPVIRRFPASRMPTTVAGINLGFFGAVTVGPLFGGAVATDGAWRWFDGGLAAVGAAVLVAALFTLPEQPPPKHDLRFDLSGIALGFAAAVLTFWGAAELTGHGFNSPLFLGPMVGGILFMVALLLVEYHRVEPLAPVKPMWNTFPVLGTLAAMIGGGAFITFMDLGLQLLRRVGGQPASATGLAFWPQVAAVIIGATLLGLLIRTRFLALLVAGGMAALVAGGALLLAAPPTPGTFVLAAAGLLGLGAGASVSPGLYLAGLSLPSQTIGRTFALVELVRATTDYVMAPMLRQVAKIYSAGAGLTTDGVRAAIWITMATAGGITLFGVALYLLSGSGLQAPDLEGWLKGSGAAIRSPPLLAALRPAVRKAWEAHSQQSEG